MHCKMQRKKKGGLINIGLNVDKIKHCLTLIINYTYVFKEKKYFKQSFISLSHTEDNKQTEMQTNCEWKQKNTATFFANLPRPDKH